MNQQDESVGMNDVPEEIFRGNTVNGLVNMKPDTEAGGHNVFLSNVYEAYKLIGERFRQGIYNRQQHAHEKAKIMSVVEMKKMQLGSSDKRLDSVHFPELP